MKIKAFMTIVATLFAIPCFGEFEYKRIDPQEFLAEQEAKQAAVVKRNREKYVRLRSVGGSVIESERPRPACVSERHFLEYMAFVLYGDGDLPSKKKCWELTTGDSLIMPEHSKYSRPPICNETFDVCRFKYDTLFSIKGEFYTAIHIVKPN